MYKGGQNNEDALNGYSGKNQDLVPFSMNLTNDKNDFTDTKQSAIITLFYPEFHEDL